MQQGVAYPSLHFKNMKLDNTKKDSNNNTSENKNEAENAGNNTAEIIPNTFQSSIQYKPTFTHNKCKEFNNFSPIFPKYEAC